MSNEHKVVHITRDLHSTVKAILSASRGQVLTPEEAGMSTRVEYGRHQGKRECERRKLREMRKAGLIK